MELTFLYIHFKFNKNVFWISKLSPYHMQVMLLLFMYYDSLYLSSLIFRQAQGSFTLKNNFIFNLSWPWAKFIRHNFTALYWSCIKTKMIKKKILSTAQFVRLWYNIMHLKLLLVGCNILCYKDTDVLIY